jgi:hypothetical protein
VIPDTWETKVRGLQSDDPMRRITKAKKARGMIELIEHLLSKAQGPELKTPVPPHSFKKKKKKFTP